jgi:hypothetical protein
MDKKCPSCGNIDGFTPTLLSEEYVCTQCDSTFSEVSHEAYTAPNYRLFCENVIGKMRSELNDACISSAIGQLKKGYINDGKEYAKDFITRLSGVATELYRDYKAGLREEYDFRAIMEGVERLIEFQNLQNPDDEEFQFPGEEDKADIIPSSNPDENNGVGVGDNVDIQNPSEVFSGPSKGRPDLSTIDPNAMVGANASPPEKNEHLALSSFKANVEALKNSLAMLNQSEEQEAQYGSDEGLDHEEKERGMLDALKGAVSNVQSSLNDYLQNEVNAHYNAPELRNKVDAIAGQLNSGAMDENISFAKGDVQAVYDEACAMLQECGMGMSEDAQLVSQGDVDNQYHKSLQRSTQEMGSFIQENVERHKPGRYFGEGINWGPHPEDTPGYGVEDPHDTLASLAADKTKHLGNDLINQPGEVNDAPPMYHPDFEKGQQVSYENEQWTVTNVTGNVLSLVNQAGETIDIPDDQVGLSDMEEIDVRDQHSDKGIDDLREIWKSMENTMESGSLVAPHRMFDENQFHVKKKGIYAEAQGEDIAAPDENSSTAQLPMDPNSNSNVAVQGQGQ